MKKDIVNYSRCLAASCVALAMLLTILISGCGAKPYPRDPMGVYVAFTLCIIDGNADEAEKYCADSFKGTSEYKQMMGGMKMMSGMMSGMMPDMDKKDRKEMEEGLNDILSTMVQSDIQGDTAKIWTTGQEFSKIILTKEGSRWKISGLDVDESAAMKAMQDMMKGM